jgi:outer membrane protein
LKKLLFSIACALAFLSEAGAQEYLTLEDAIRLGLDSNYAIRIASQNQDIAANIYSLGEAGLLPTLDATAGRNWSLQDVELRFRNEPEPVVRGGARSSSASSSLLANYTLNLGGVYAFRQLGTLSQISELEAKVTIENTVAAIATAYYRIVLEQQRYELLQNTLDLSEERLRISKDKYELGRASKQEFLAAQVDYNTDLTALINQEEVIATARLRLNELMAQDPRQEMMVKDTILVDNTLSLTDLLSATNLENPRLMVAQRQINAAHLQMQELRAQQLPQLNLFGSYNRQLNQAEAGIFLSNQSAGFNYGFGASWNLFNGLVLRRRIQNARIRENVQQLGFQNLQLELEADVNQVFISYRNSLRLLEVARSNYEVAEENADIALERYKLGNTSSLEFREAQQNALAAQSRLINVLYTIKEAEIELQRLAGTALSGFES